jgi:phenolic acid decarboxylase
MKTKKDLNGNYTGSYKGFDFIIYNHQEGWHFDVYYYNDLILSDDSFSSLEYALGYYSTKRHTLIMLKECIENKDWV